MFARSARVGGVAAILAAAGTTAAAQTIQLDGIVVTATKTSETAVDVLGGASAIAKDQLDQQFQADQVSGILRTVPGVTTQETARDTAQSLNIRGLQDFGRVNVLIDGMRQNFQRSGHSANGSFYIEPEMIKRIDITRGPTSTIYGSGAIGGVAAFELIDADDILEPGQSVAMRLRSRFSSNGFGPFGSVSGAAKIGNFDIMGQLNGRDVESYEDGRGLEIPNSGEETGSTLARSRWRFAPGHQIAGTALGYGSNFIDSTDERVSAIAPARDSRLENMQANLSYTFSRPDMPFFDVSAKIYRNETDLFQKTLTGSQTGKTRGFNVTTVGFDVSNTSRWNFGGAKLALTYGADAFEDRVQVFDNNVSALAAPASRFTPTGTRTVSGAFSQAHLTLWDFIDLIGAVRYDTYELCNANVTSEGDRISPKATVGFTPVPGITLFATYAEGYRAPHLTETVISGIHATLIPFRFLPNPGLRPEVAHNTEVGMNLKKDGWLSPNDAFREKLTAFRNRVDDYIDLFNFDPTNDCFNQRGFPNPAFCVDSTSQYVNIANATLEGVEFEAAYDARTWFVGLGAHRIRGTNDATKAALATVPADQVTVTLGARAWGDKVTAGTRTRFVAAQDRVPAGEIATDAYTILDLFAEYRHTDDLTFNLNVDNVFDKEYRQYLDQSNSPGLNARVGLTMRLGAN